MNIVLTVFISFSLVVPAMAQVPARQNNAVRFEQNTKNEFVESVGRSREAQREVRNKLQVRVESLSGEARPVIRLQEVAPQAVEELRVRHNELKAEIQRQGEEFSQVITAKREELKTELEQRRVELTAQLQTIRDERREAIVEHVYDEVNALNERLTKHYAEVLNTLDTILGRVVTRTDKAEAAGLDVSTVRPILEDAVNLIASGRALVAEQAGKTYSFSIVSTSTLRSAVGAGRNRLHEDLKSVQDEIKSARDGIRRALTALAQIPHVDAIQLEAPTTSTPSEATTNNQ